MKKIIISAILFATLLVSCNKFLDTKPEVVLTPFQAYQTADNINAALAGIYTNLKSIYASSYETQYTVSTDESYYYNTGLPFVIYANTSTDGSVGNTAGFWRQCYQSIYYANTLIDNIDASAAAGKVDAVLVRKAKGESYFLRGYYYFLLAQWFGGVPIQLHTSPDPTQVYFPRAPLSDVYNQIVSDMKVADSLLYDQTFKDLGYSERISQETVEGILARVCLFAAGQPNNDTKKYKDALYWSTKLINSNKHNLINFANKESSYAQVFIDECQNKYNEETIWEIGFNQKGPGNLSSGGGVGIYCGIGNSVASSSTTNGNIYDSGYCYAYVKLHPRLFCSYQSGDYRRNWNVANFSYSNLKKTPFTNNKFWSRNPAKWRREYEPPISRSVQVASQTNFPMLRFSDVLLMQAEAENEVNGPTQIAYDAINKVRERSISATSIIDSLSVVAGSGYLSIPTFAISNNTGNAWSVQPTYTSSTNVTTGITTYAINALLVSQGNGFTSTPIITVGNQWAASTYDSVGLQVAAPNGRLYTVTVAGTTTTTPPTNTSGSSKATTTGAVFTYAGVACQVKLILTAPQNPDLTTGLSQADFRTAIQMERYRELAFEALRMGDLRRWGILIPTIQSLSADINGKNAAYPQIPSIVSELGANSDATPLAPIYSIGLKDWFWPIPQYDISLNPLLTQNPGY